MIWGTDIQVSETKAAARKFFTEFVAEGEEESKYMKLLEQAYMRGAGFINLDCGHVRSFDIDLYEKLVRFPTEAITILDVVLTELYSETYQYRSDFMEVQIVSRPFNLLDTAVMRDLNPSDVDKLVSIKGMIIRRLVRMRAWPSLILITPLIGCKGADSFRAHLPFLLQLGDCSRHPAGVL